MDPRTCFGPKALKPNGEEAVKYADGEEAPVSPTTVDHLVVAAITIVVNLALFLILRFFFLYSSPFICLFLSISSLLIPV